MSSNKKVLTLIGPTASGKTAISIQICRLIKDKLNKNPKIISADSRQVYKKIPIAVSQPAEKYLKEFKHHFINELELNEEFNAGEFGKEARKILDKIFAQKKIPVIVGGSGLYISSLIYGLFDFDESLKKESKSELKKIRISLHEKLEKEGFNNLYNELKKIDPESAVKMKNTNQRRIIRALEVYYLTGIPLSILQSKKINVGFKPVLFGINWERKKLYERINHRVNSMIESGLVEEVRKLKKKGYNYNQYNSLNTVGIKESFDYLEGKIGYNRMIELIKQNTRRFAKRQMTWFRKDKNINWLDVEDEKDFERIAEKIFDSFF